MSNEPIKPFTSRHICREFICDSYSFIIRNPRWTLYRRRLGSRRVKTARASARGREQRISIEDAIRAYTYNTAYANFEEKIKGSIEAGKLADIVALSKNLLRVPPKEFLMTEAAYTMVGGRVVYRTP